MIPGEVEHAVQEAYAQIESGKVERKSSTGQDSRWNFRRAAAIAIATLAIGTTAFAATRQSTIFDYFSGYTNGRALPEQAKSLIETEIAQKKVDNGIVSFSVREALCDKNTIFVAIEAKAAEPDKYLLVPEWYHIQDGDYAKKMNMSSLNPSMPEKKMKIADYLEKYNKELLPISLDLDTGADETSSFFNLEEDGTALFTWVSENIIHKETMNLSCRTDVSYHGELLTDMLDFTINDSSEENEIFLYRAAGNEPVKGTNVIIDELKLEKSAINITCTLTSHYAGDPEKIPEDFSIPLFSFFGPDGKQLKNGPGIPGGAERKDGVFTQTETLALTELPEQITLQSAEGASKTFGPVTVYRTDK